MIKCVGCWFVLTLWLRDFYSVVRTSAVMSLWLTVLVIFNLWICQCDVVTVTIYDITTYSEGPVAGHWLAVQEINNNLTFLPNYTLDLKIFDIGYQSHTAIIDTLEVVNSPNNETHLSFPIILGAPWSAVSITINPILASFNMGQISSFATSTSLSDKTKYPTFYRYNK